MVATARPSSHSQVIEEYLLGLAAAIELREAAIEAQDDVSVRRAKKEFDFAIVNILGLLEAAGESYSGFPVADASIEWNDGKTTSNLSEAKAIADKIIGFASQRPSPETLVLANAAKAVYDQAHDSFKTTNDQYIAQLKSGGHSMKVTRTSSNPVSTSEHDDRGYGKDIRVRVRPPENRGNKSGPNRGKRRQAKKSGLGGLNPKSQPTGDPGDWMANLIRWFISPGGHKFLWSVVLLGSTLVSGYQYQWVLKALFGAPEGLIGWGMGAVMSLTFSMIEALPRILQVSSWEAYREVYREASKPNRMPVMSGRSVEGGGKDVLENYRRTGAEVRRSQKLWRAVCFTAEIMIGLIFFGNLGTGLLAIGKIVLFILSIFAGEKSIVSLLCAQERDLPPLVKKVFNQQLKNRTIQLS